MFDCFTTEELIHKAYLEDNHLAFELVRRFESNIDVMIKQVTKLKKDMQELESTFAYGVE